MNVAKRYENSSLYLSHAVKLTSEFFAPFACYYDNCAYAEKEGIETMVLWADRFFI